MSDSQELAPELFKKVLNNIELQMRVLRGQESFSINLLNLQRPECFEQIITSSYMRDHQDLLVLFETPTNLMKHIAAHYKDLRIQRGRIRFSINFSKALGPKQVTLDIKEKNVDKVEFVNTNVKKMKEKLVQKEESIEWLRREVLKMMDYYQETNKLVKNFLLYPFVHQKGYQNHYFSTQFTGKSIIVNHNSEGQPENHIFVLNQEICVGYVKKYTLKTVRSEQMDQLCFCFGSKHILSDNQISNNWVVAYQCDGGLNEGERFRQSKVCTGVSNQFQCEINLIQYNIKWMMKGEIFDITELPQEMRNLTLYFAVLFSAKNERIEIALD